MTDAFLELDRVLGKKLFRPQPGETRVKLAAYEACKAKKCVGALRALWRSSKTGGMDDNIRRLKSFLLPSPEPSRRRRRGQEPESSSDMDNDDRLAVSDPESEEPEPDSEEECEPEPVEEAPAPIADASMSSAESDTGSEEVDAKSVAKTECTSTTLRLGETSPKSSESSACL